MNRLNRDVRAENWHCAIGRVESRALPAVFCNICLLTIEIVQELAIAVD
jgi:hypothetical protein